MNTEDFRKYLEDAIQGNKKVKIKYKKYGGECSERQISNIQYSDEFGEDYISAYCHLRQENRTFKIDRIESIDGIKNPSNHREIISSNSRYSSYSSQISSLSSINSDRQASVYSSKNSTSNYSNSPKNKSEGCYIATMAYGSYDHPQVMILRHYRDRILLKSMLGRISVRIYYWISPTIVKCLKNQNNINFIIRKSLNKIVTRISKIDDIHPL